MNEPTQLWHLVVVGVILAGGIVWSHQQTHVEMSEALVTPGP